MKLDRLMVWRFTTAPKNLKSLHTGSETPEWLVLIPAALSGPDIDEAILRGSKPGDIARHETPDGDIVYTGNSKLDQVAEIPGAIFRPAAMTAIQSRRK